MATLKDIAKMANVSVSTVSKALNGNSEIGFRTRDKIVQIARDMKYSFEIKAPEAIAESKIIGVICPEISSNYYTQLVNSISNSISRKGYFFMVGVTDFSAEKEKHFIEIFLQKGVDGIIFITENNEIQEMLDNTWTFANSPIVLIANDTDARNLDYIKIDDYYGVELALEHLIRLGHKEICFIGDRLTGARCGACIDILKKYDITLDENMVKISDSRFEKGGYDCMREVLSSKCRPTAVFAAYDDMAIGVIRAINEASIIVPDDISVIGFDNIIVCPYLTKSLSTISNPVKEMAAVSVDILFRKIENSDFRVIQHIVLKPELVVRETTVNRAEK